MAYDEQLDTRIAQAIAGWGTTRKKMFGGTGYMLNGNLLCGVHKTYLILRLGEEAENEALNSPHASRFDITGRPMKGWVKIDAQGAAGDLLLQWLLQAKKFVQTLPAK